MFRASPWSRFAKAGKLYKTNLDGLRTRNARTYTPGGRSAIASFAICQQRVSLCHLRIAVPVPLRRRASIIRSNEHDACGMGFVASIRGEKSHDIIRKGLEVLINLTHRGAAGCDPETGDGAGILIQVPHVFFARECGELGMQLPEAGAYGVAMCFLPVDKHSRLQCEGALERIAQQEGAAVIGWRDTPVNGDAIGREARNSQPYIEQLFVAPPRRPGRGSLRAPPLPHPPPLLKTKSPTPRSRARRTSTFLRSPAAPSSTRA